MVRFLLQAHANQALTPLSIRRSPNSMEERPSFYQGWTGKTGLKKTDMA